MFIRQKLSKSYERQTLPIQSISANTDATRPILTQLGQYRHNLADITWPITMTSSASFSYPYKHGGRVSIDNSKIKLTLINKIVINQVISHWPSYGSSICCIGPWPLASANTADLRPVTGPIRNYLINNIIVVRHLSRC